ncbi:MAG: hypothetical protein HN390_13495 [Anaerolineae bacterium]|jgi:hypothetical protein|nr:hypothetical protein [Anaerolineae bacterium]MBT7188661.1 hypothetical protein [Anaerolineae bacterium]MBT7989817.1 hypothetical protein [Anaerolineae bacterium]
MKTKLIPLLALSLFISACAPIVDESLSDISPTLAPASPTNSEIPPNSKGEIDFISNSEIQFLSTQTDLLSATQIDILLQAKAVWIAGIPHEDGTAWAIALEDGRLEAFAVNQNGFEEIEISPKKLPARMPLTIYSSNGDVFALTAPSDASSLTQPVLIDPASHQIAYIATNGDLVISQEGQESRLAVNALVDSRILLDEEGRLLFLSSPTESYAHSVLGDGIESTAITLVETNPVPKIVQVVSIPKADAIEGIAPIWADMNNDSEGEIIVTLSNVQDGARIVAYREDGSLLAEGPAIGSGYRWRHQLVIAPFGSSDENLLAVVRTPHIGGVLEFYRLDGNKLEIVKTIPGISTHSIGSRNLYTAQAGDFNTDGQIDLLAPDQSHTRLGIISIESESINWIDLGAELVTNLAAVNSDNNDQIAIGAGLSNNILRIWLP